VPFRSRLRALLLLLLLLLAAPVPLCAEADFAADFLTCSWHSAGLPSLIQREHGTNPSQAAFAM
jgi:hypothetical protein